MLGFSALYATIAEPDRVEVGRQLPRFGNLKPGVRHYLRHRVLKGTVRSIDIWTRELRLEEKDGKRLLNVRQTWTGPTVAPHTLTIQSRFELGTFRPLKHERRYERAGHHRQMNGKIAI